MRTAITYASVIALAWSSFAAGIESQHIPVNRWVVSFYMILGWVSTFVLARCIEDLRKKDSQ